MKTFSGFPTGKVRTVATPEPVYTDLIPIIDDLAELKLSLHVLWRLGQKQGKVRYLTHADLSTDHVLISSLGGGSPEVLDAALARAVERGTLLKAGSAGEEVYFANTEKGRAAVKAISHGEWPDDLESAGRPNVFALYEQNIGMLTPLIAEELREAEHTYPADWLEEAFREAVSLNKRSWKYIRAILERWRAEGKGDEESRRSGQADRQRYIKGEYAEYIEH
jgi:DnaD/phage-associated family protein